MKKERQICKSVVIVLFFLGGFSTPTKGQHAITYECNAIRAEDSLLVELVDYAEAYGAGENQVWDFSGQKVYRSFMLRYLADTLDIIRCIDYGSNINYKEQEKQQMIYSKEDPQNTMNYQLPIVSLKYPMLLGDSVSNSFCGEGKYCGRFFSRNLGTLYTKADASGSIILEEGDTLRNALRTHTYIEADIRMNIDSCANDTDRHVRERTDLYRWYVRGCRYPVLESARSVLAYNDSVISTTETSRRMLPEWQFTGDDESSQTISDNEERTEGSNFCYQLEYEGNRVSISYDLRERATLKLIIADISGMVYRSANQTTEAGQGYTLDLDCSSLKRGHYVVYINVNGKIYNSKIEVK